MFWLAYLFTVIVGGTFAVILRVLRKVLRGWGQATNSPSKTCPVRTMADIPVRIAGQDEKDIGYRGPVAALAPLVDTPPIDAD